LLDRQKGGLERKAMSRRPKRRDYLDTAIVASWRWHEEDVEVAGQNRRRAALQKSLGVARQPFEPAQLVIEFRARRRIAVRQIEATDDQAADRRFDVPAVRIVGIARQAAAGLLRLGAPGEDRHAVPAFHAPGCGKDYQKSKP
jgi:hypothetical protein